MGGFGARLQKSIEWAPQLLGVGVSHKKKGNGVAQDKSTVKRVFNLKEFVIYCSFNFSKTISSYYLYTDTDRIVMAFDLMPYWLQDFSISTIILVVMR